MFFKSGKRRKEITRVVMAMNMQLLDQFVVEKETVNRQCYARTSIIACLRISKFFYWYFWKIKQKYFYNINGKY